MKFLQCTVTSGLALRMLTLSAEEAMSYSLYLLGFGILIVGLAYGANLMGIPRQWIAVGVIVLIGLGVLTGVSRTRTRDQSH
jgi:hypothetical protein